MMAEMLRSVQYIVDPQGKPSAAVLDINIWKRFVEWMEDQEDLVDAREALKELSAAGNDAEKAGWPRLQDIRDELNG